jgi:LPXTG-motif cell wall-anchored protein
LGGLGTLPATGQERMNQIIYIVGLVVIVLFILGYFGLR